MLTFDLETAPQLKYLDVDDHTLDLLDWADPKWYEDHPEMTRPEYLAALRAGEVPVKATGVLPSLHPTTFHIVAASFGGYDKVKGNTVDVKTLRDFGTSDDYGELLDQNAEVSLVQTCLDRVAWCVNSKTARPLVTFNGKSADLWWLMIRAMLLDLKAKDTTRAPINWGSVLYPFRNDPHLDLRLFLGNGDRRARGKLSWWAEAFDLPAEEKGAEVCGMVLAGKWGELEAYGMEEGHTLMKFYERTRDWAGWPK